MILTVKTNQQIYYINVDCFLNCVKMNYLIFSHYKPHPYLLFTSVIGLSGGLFGMALNYLLTMADPFEDMMRLSAVLNTQVGFHSDPFTCFCTCISEVL